MIVINDPIIKINDDENNILISYNFNVPNVEFSTSGTWISELFANQTITFQSSEPIKDITEWWEINDKLIGDVEFFNIIKEFRYSENNTDYSSWNLLNIDNFSTIPLKRNLYLQFRYSAIDQFKNYDFKINVDKPYNNGWFKVYSNNIEYKIIDDYPTRGDIKYTLGWGTNGEYHIDLNTSKLYVKNNGIWSGGVYFQENGTTGTYLPNMFNNQILSNNFITNISSKWYGIPINDYILTNDIRFSINKNIIPSKGDNIYINPLIQGIKLQGKEELTVTYKQITLPNNYIKRIYIKELELFANQWIETVSSEPLFCLNNVGDQKIFKPPVLLKLYNIDSFKVEVDGKCSTAWNTCLDIKFRYSFNSRKWDTVWIPLTLSNLKCIKPNPLNFFYIEFLFTKTCDNMGKPICISDIVINGNIQNVSNDYEKLNRFGLRSDCNYGISLDDNSDACPTSCDTNIPHDWFAEETNCNPSTLFNPYDMTQIVAFNEKMANDVNSIFGWEIDYYKVSANELGIDKVLHEYGTFDTVDKQKLKILIPDNKFPEDMISFNRFDMSLFDSFEIHITKKEFYSKFGVGTRPAQNDFLFICQINKYYKVSHAQSFRDFMNSAVYFKVTLDKKQDDTHIDNGTYTDSLNDLIQNNQLDNLLGKTVQENINKVINDPTLQNLTELDSTNTKFKYDDNVQILANKGVDKDKIMDYRKPDPIYNQINVSIIEKDLENGSTVISRSYYDLSTKINDNAIIYGNLDTIIDDCIDKSFLCWFSIPKYQSGMIYNFIDNLNPITNIGYKIIFVDGKFKIYFNDQLFTVDVSVSLGNWYGLIINFKQKEHRFELYLYKRKGNCTTNDLELVNFYENNLVPISYNDSNILMKINGSYMYLTNIRIFNEIINIESHSLVLSQYIIKNTDYLILGDNCDKIIKTKNFKY